MYNLSNIVINVHRDRLLTTRLTNLDKSNLYQISYAFNYFLIMQKNIQQETFKNDYYLFVAHDLK